MSVGSHLSDFVGYDVGVPVVVPPATVGYVGFLDFAGFPVGVPAVVPPTPTPSGNFMIGGIPIQDPLYWRKKKIWNDDEEFIARQLHDV